VGCSSRGFTFAFFLSPFALTGRAAGLPSRNSLFRFPVSPAVWGEGTNMTFAASTGMTEPGGMPAGFLPRPAGAVRPPVPVQRAQALWIEDGLWADAAGWADASGWSDYATLECQALKINRVRRIRVSRVVTEGG
jgi:hypothetical protein